MRKLKAMSLMSILIVLVASSTTIYAHDEPRTEEYEKNALNYLDDGTPGVMAAKFKATNYMLGDGKARSVEYFYRCGWKQKESKIPKNICGKSKILEARRVNGVYSGGGCGKVSGLVVCSDDTSINPDRITAQVYQIGYPRHNIWLKFFDQDFRCGTSRKEIEKNMCGKDRDVLFSRQLGQSYRGGSCGITRFIAVCQTKDF